MSRSHGVTLAALLAAVVGCGETQSAGAPDSSTHADGGSSSQADGGASMRRDASMGTQHDSSAHMDARTSRDADSHGDSARETGNPPVDASDSDASDAMMNPDAFGCIASCTSNEACGETCMAGFETSYCCDMTAHQCFVNPEEGPCPLHAGSCDAAGCPAGEMCVAFINPEFIASPACYTLPMVCGDDPTCSCLAAAGVCGDGGFPFCADGGGASISCGL